MPQINTTPLTKLGNMTTNGIASLFDGSTATNAYFAGTAGWAGVTLAAPTRIEKVEIVSQTNGFDASGSASSITLRLYGKAGSAPTSLTDGVLLATDGPFTDPNAMVTRTLVSGNQTTQFDHVWVTVSTGVWAAAVEIRFFDVEVVVTPPTPTEPIVAIPLDAYYIERIIATDTKITQAPVEPAGWVVEFELTQPRLVRVDFHSDAKHDTDSSLYSMVIGVGFRLLHRFGTTATAMDSASPTYVPGAVGGANILNRTDHYMNKAFSKYMTLQAGFHRLSINASGHTNGTTADNLISIYGDYNNLSVFFHPAS